MLLFLLLHLECFLHRAKTFWDEYIIPKSSPILNQTGTFALTFALCAEEFSSGEGKNTINEQASSHVRGNTCATFFLLTV